MAIEDPGTLTVTCDKCGKSAQMDTTEYAGDLPTWGIDRDTLKDNDWDATDDGVVCPECKGDQEDD